LLSLAPLLTIVTAMAGLIFGRNAVQGQILADFRVILGPSGAAAIQEFVRDASKAPSGLVAVTLGFVMLAIGATAIFAELQTDLDKIWKVSVPQTEGILDLLRDRLLAFAMVLGVGFLLLVSLIVSAGLSAFGRWWGGWMTGWTSLVQILDGAFSVIFITILFAMIYKFLPRTPVSWRDVWIGSIITSFLFTIGKIGIVIYIARSNFDESYGAAGSLLFLLVWIYYAAQIFLLGAEFTAIYARRGAQSGAFCPGKESSSTASPAPL
jgi:membrane protein